MTIMITPKRDLYFKNCDPLPENLYGKQGEWYIVREYNEGGLVFTSETGNSHTYDEETLNKDYYTIDFDKGFSYKFQDQEYFIKDRKWDGKIQVPVETCITNIERGYWEITRYSNDPIKEENSSEKLRNYWCDFVEENSILASFPVPEDDVKKCIYEESLSSLKAHLVSLTYADFLFEFNKYNKPHNPVKNISRGKYYRCANRKPTICEQFNSDRGILFMSESACGKYYYWEGHNSKNDIIYFRGEKSWVEANYEKREGFEENDSEEDNLLKVLADTKEGLERSLSEEGDTLPKDSNAWTDKHYNFSYTLTEDDIEKGEVKIDPYFVNQQWKLNSKDDTGIIFHQLKTLARWCDKNTEEREIRALFGQVKRLAEIKGVVL